MAPRTLSTSGTMVMWLLGDFAGATDENRIAPVTCRLWASRAGQVPLTDPPLRYFTRVADSPRLGYRTLSPPRRLAANEIPPRGSQLVVRGAQPPPGFLCKLAVKRQASWEPNASSRVQFETTLEAKMADRDVYGGGVHDD